MEKNAEINERALKSGKISQQQYDNFHLIKDSIELMYAHPFLEGIGIVLAMIRYRKKVRCDSKLLSLKYKTKLSTFAMNELLGRPAPRVSTLKPMIFEARQGNYEDLDHVLGFVDSDGKEIQGQSVSQQRKMHDVMDGVLSAQGKEFYAIVDCIAEYYCMVFDKFFAKKESQKKEAKKKAFEVDLQKFYENLFKSAVKPSEAKTTNDTKKSNEPSKTKSAKDFEHYRKTKRPARL